MASPHPTLSRSRPAGAFDGRAAALLCVTAALIFFGAGAGMLEGHAIYPSWRDLADFPEFAAYHAGYGRALLPWLPLPLLLATIGNAWLVRRRPDGVPRGLVVATLIGQLIVIIVTVTLALPIQAELATAGHTADEIIALVDRLIAVGYFREIPGLAVAAGFIVMLYRAIRGSSR